MVKTNQTRATKSPSSTQAISTTKIRPAMTIEESSKPFLSFLYIPTTADWSCRFDSSVNRGDFKTQIGVGKVIKGLLCSIWIGISTDRFRVG